MFFWVLLAVLTAVAITFVLRPLTASGAAIKEAAEADIAVYKDQLSEIESDLDRGLISADEAEAARAELARRLLKRADAADAQKAVAGQQHHVAMSKGGSGRSLLGIGREHVALIGAGVIPIFALATYLGVGSPGLPMKPFAEQKSVAERPRQAPETSPIGELVAKVEARLRENPSDGRGWEVVAPVYLRLQRYDDAVQAFANASKLLGETPRRLFGLAQAEVAAHSGVVSTRAKAAYERLLELEPDHADALFWLGQAAEQAGDGTLAVARYRRLLEISPKEAEWRSSVEQRISALGAGGPAVQQDGAVASGTLAQSSRSNSGNEAPATGPTADQVAAAQDMTADEQQAMISNMVSNLAERLDKDGNDADGWKRLIRAYMVMGRRDDAQQALEKAKSIFAENEGLRKDIEAAARSMGL